MSVRDKSHPRRGVINTAYHEAGHAVAHYCFFGSGDTIDISIVPNESDGNLGHHAPVYGLEARWVEPTEEEKALCRERGDHEPTGVACYDRQEVLNAVVGHYAGAEADARFEPALKAEALAHGQRDDEQAAELLEETLGEPELEAELRVLAAEFVRERWAEIDAVARELLQAKTLDGTEIAIIIEAVRGQVDPNEELTRYRLFRSPPGGEPD